MNYIQELENKISNLTKEQKDWLNNFGISPVLRIFMDSTEIKQANKFVKSGLMEKGKSDQGYVQYYIDSSVWSRI